MRHQLCAVALATTAMVLTPAGVAAASGAATPNANVNLTASFTASVPVYRVDGGPGDGFNGFSKTVGLASQTYCFDTRTLLTTTPQMCTATTPSFYKLNVPATPQLGFKYETKCEAAQLDLSFIAPELDVSRLSFPGALRLYTDVAVGGTIPINFLGRVINIPIPLIPVLNDQALGYTTRGKTEADVQAAVASLDAMLTDPSLVQNILGGAGLLSGLLDANGNLAIDLTTLTADQAQALLAQIQQLWPFLQVVSPVFLPPVHAYHDACRTEQEMAFNIQFRKTATLVNAGSGNQQLNFKAWAPLGNFFGLFDANIHYQAGTNKSALGMTRAQGILLSTDAMFFIDLAQFDRTPSNVLTPLMDGTGINVKACMTFLPSRCVGATLRAAVQ